MKVSSSDKVGAKRRMIGLHKILVILLQIKWCLWCKGSTTDCGSVSLGSNPSIHPTHIYGVMVASRSPKALVWVRILVGVQIKRINLYPTLNACDVFLVNGMYSFHHLILITQLRMWMKLKIILK